MLGEVREMVMCDVDVKLSKLPYNNVANASAVQYEKLFKSG